MTTAAQIIESAERFTLTTDRRDYGRNAKVGTFVHHGFDERDGVDGTLHQVLVIPVDDEMIRVYVSLNGRDNHIADLDVWRLGHDALLTKVRDEVANWLATQVGA